ncbi:MULTISPECIES: PDR/VanB family oxidoreductase [Roseobacteraceae]|jgi:phthalate 4,5-dioxygenase reductase component|uniref:PDR/VanB family oxidoreductase n=1 Tax=Roseobacteraceae TaxID=2854170 RepID=UPI0007D91025|nr:MULTISPECIES: PDR/VanB family oxidoreductase [Roseobacteraceae]MDR6267523.1 phthalate 4,5-dioxygenase reductase subunit [Roseobacter sp. N2S]OAN89647.1 ferredoxin [Sulfitobacter geojensis]
MDALKMTVAERRQLTEHICEFTLAPADGEKLPSFTAGAHITVQTPSGAMRRYSLVNDGKDPEVYKIALKREINGRGGSMSMHDDAQEGTELQVEVPENTFELTDAKNYLLIAGGIGVTPIYAMSQQLLREFKPFEVIYCTRGEADTAFLEEMKSTLGDRLTLHHDGGDPEAVFDFWDHFEEPKDMKVYCCGPQPLIDEIEAISGHWPEGRVIFEDFKPVEVVRADDKPFEVKLEKSGITIEVPADRSILEALRESGVPTVSSCESGTCGTCKTRLVSGKVDHRDMVLMDEEKDSYVMICVSRAEEGDLVLDL